MDIRVPATKTTRAAVYREAGEARYLEAVFLKDKYPSGAIYLAGYQVECLLKWALCERANVNYLQDLPDRRLAKRLTSGRGHNMEELCRVTGYEVHIERTETARRAFQVAAVWSPSLRYVKACGGLREAVRFLAAVRVLREDIVTWANS